MRAITPIIAVILLLLMAVAAAGAAYLWITLMQSTIAGETQSGLEQNIAQMQRYLAIPSVWNDTNHVCFLVKNTGTESYTDTQLSDITVYIDNTAYDWNTSAITVAELPNGKSFVSCVCNTTEATGNEDCTGPTNRGFNYAGTKIDVKIEPPVGSGGTYNNFQNTG